MEHSIDFGSKKIKFDLQYSNRKTLGIKVFPNTEVQITAPLNTSLEEVKPWVRKKALWILKQQSYFLNFNATNVDYELKSGYSILYLGRQYKLIIETATKNEVHYQGNQFLIKVKQKKDAENVFNEWLKQRAMQKITEIALPIMKKFQQKFEIPSDLYFQEMPTRWGSCTISNKLIFNPKLIHTPKRCIEYVVMHELCHLKHKHHNQAFFNLLTQQMPDWEKRKEKLDSYS